MLTINMQSYPFSASLLILTLVTLTHSLVLPFRQEHGTLTRGRLAMRDLASANLPSFTLTPVVATVANSPPGPSSSTITTQPGSDASRKYVVAHYMVGNTFPLTADDWTADIALAYASGIDGFALNVGVDDWQPARVADALVLVERSGLFSYNSLDTKLLSSRV